MSSLGGPDTVTNGLVLALDAGNSKSYTSGSTTWYDKSGYGNNGTLVNGPAFSSQNGGSITFDGVNDYVNIPGTSLINFQPSNSFTIIAVVRPISVGGITPIVDNTSVVLGVGAAAGSYGIGFNYDQIADRYTFRVGCRSTDNTYLVADSIITPNRIYHVVLSYQTSGVQTAYINGVVVSTLSSVAFSSKTLTSSTVTGYNIFRSNAVYGGNPRYGIGNFYMGQIYNRALPASEILQNYNAIKSRFNL
jgi:hypothetical protein